MGPNQFAGEYCFVTVVLIGRFDLRCNIDGLENLLGYRSGGFNLRENRIVDVNFRAVGRAAHNLLRRPVTHGGVGRNLGIRSR